MSMNGGTVKQMLFKEENKGISKKSGNAFHMLVLHDPDTLENISFFLREDSKLDTKNILFKDKVNATFTMEFEFGRLQPVLQSLAKVS